MYDLTHLYPPIESRTEDFEQFKRECGLTEEQLFSTRLKLQAPDKLECESEVYYGPSKIHGHGVFAQHNFAMKEVIAPLNKNKAWTMTGFMINHSSEPNTELLTMRNGDVMIVAAHGIKQDSELTINYREGGL